MINSNHRRPDIRVVAVLADVRCLNMRYGFTSRTNAIVAADAVSDDICVVEGRRPPRHCRVAIIAVIAARDMRRMLADCDNTIVAGATGTDHLGVINSEHGRENIRVVTIFTNVTGLNMSRVFSGGVNAVVTVDAVADDIYMIEICR